MSVKNWDYLHTPQFFLRQQLLAKVLETSPFILDVGCYPKSIGDYLAPDSKYLAVDPLYPASTETIRNCKLNELNFNTNTPFDLVLLGIDLPVDEVLLNYCHKANRIVLEFPICYEPSVQKAKQIIAAVKKNKEVVYDFTMDFSNIPLKLDLSRSWPARYKRRIIVLKTTVS